MTNSSAKIELLEAIRSDALGGRHDSVPSSDVEQQERPMDGALEESNPHWKQTKVAWGEWREPILKRGSSTTATPPPRPAQSKAFLSFPLFHTEP